ncbi:terminase small subunit [Microbulbifer sp. ALW1]|uniref:terminase small subunit n=1 Tax=Microbulbifer sp. (strain ALW1) TaxID=1516059 RepID=UPI0013598FD9|nr:terminase small subunit [Microbulbifer sp. ALW1]
MAESKRKARKKQSETLAEKVGKKSGNTKQTAPSEVRDCLLNQRQMCESLSVTAPGFARWGVEPTERVGNQAFYSVRDVVDNRVAAALDRQKLERPDPDDGDGLNPVLEQARLAKERADGLALKNKQARGELIPVEIAGPLFGKIASEMAAVLDALEAKIKRRVPSLTATDMEFIKAERVRAQNAAADVDRLLDELLDEIIGAADTGS